MAEDGAGKVTADDLGTAGATPVKVLQAQAIGSAVDSLGTKVEEGEGSGCERLSFNSPIITAEACEPDEPKAEGAADGGAERGPDEAMKVEVGSVRGNMGGQSAPQAGGEMMSPGGTGPFGPRAGVW